MSNPRTKAERSKAKDARQQRAPDVLKTPPAKKAKPFVLEHRYSETSYWGRKCPQNREWYAHGRYRTEEATIKAAKDQLRKSDLYEFRLSGKEITI